MNIEIMLDFDQHHIAILIGDGEIYAVLFDVFLLLVAFAL